jgi:methylenetetrahydrofolate dehydrogenase (NAD+)
VVGRPLAALLANDGARVLSVDIDCRFYPLAYLIVAIVEFSKRPTAAGSKLNPHHVVNPTDLTLEQCLGISDVVISAVPSQSYKVSTNALKDGCVCVNVAGEKNFEADVRERVRARWERADGRLQFTCRASG